MRISDWSSDVCSSDQTSGPLREIANRFWGVQQLSNIFTSSFQLKLALLSGVHLAAFAALPAHAQTGETVASPTGEDAQDAQDDVADIVVTGSRVARGGFEAPTTTTMLNANETERVSTPNNATLAHKMRQTHRA